MTENQILFSLLRSQLNGVPVENDTLQSLSLEVLEAVCKLADAHDLGHLVGQVLSGCKELPESQVVAAAKQRAMQAVFRYVNQSHDLAAVCKTLEDAQIPHIPLKGSVLRDYYPEPWFRTSGDIDVLVRKEDLEKASQVLQDVLGYQYRALTNHDIALTSATGNLLELHYDLTEDLVSPAQSEVMACVWEESSCMEGKTYGRQMPDALFYFYHIAHMAKHFIYGGCGIRPLMDLWIMNRKMSFDREQCDALLRKGELEAFSQKAEQLSEVWFSGVKADSLCQQMEQYILSGGVYGTVENRVTMSSVRSGGKLKYVLSRVFLSYDQLQYYYPALQKHKWLYPFCQVARWFRLIFGGGKAHALESMRTNAHLDDESLNSTEQFLKNIGL